MTEQTDTFYFDSEFQCGILELMMKDGDFCYKAIYRLKPEYFSNQYYAWFFTTIKKLYEQFQTVPTGMMIVNEILMSLKIEERQPYSTLFEKIIKGSPTRNFDYIRKHLTHFIKRSKMWQLNQKMVQNKYTDPDKLYHEAMKDIDDMAAVSFDKDDSMTLDNIEQFLQKCSEASEKLLPLGLPDIDKALGGGIPKKTLTTIIGGTNVGKSISLINIANHLVKSGYKVLYVNLEGQDQQPLLRIISRNTRTPYGRVRFNQLTEQERAKAKKMQEDFKDRFQLKHVAAFNYTVEDLYAYARDKKRDFNFDALIVDYGQLLSSKQKTEGLRHTQAYVHRCLSSIGGALDCAVFTVAQGTRDIQEKNRRGTELLRMNDISECFEINRVSAQVLTLNRSESDEQNERIRILLDKQRDGKKGVIQICKTDFQSISLYGTAEEGLGFITANDYMVEEMAAMDVEQNAKGQTQAQNTVN